MRKDFLPNINNYSARKGALKADLESQSVNGSRVTRWQAKHPQNPGIEAGSYIRHGRELGFHIGSYCCSGW
jgi:hypothetical protein